MSDTPRTDAVERAHGLAWFGLHDEVGRYLDGMVKFREKAKELERELAAANARAEKLEKAILKIRQALLPDPHDEREISIDWVRGAIGRIADAAIAAKEKP